MQCLPRKTYWSYVRDVFSRFYRSVVVNVLYTRQGLQRLLVLDFVSSTCFFSMGIILVFKPPFVAYCLRQIFWFRKSCPTSDTQTYHDIVSPFSLDEETAQENIPSSSSTEQYKQNRRNFLGLWTLSSTCTKLHNCFYPLVF